MKQVKILIVDDHPVVRKGIRQILEDEERISLICEAGNLREINERLKSELFDVILLDISLPGYNGLELIRPIKKKQKSAGILVLSIYSEDVYAIRAIKKGASGYITKSSPPEELVSAIFKVSEGERYISASLVEKIVGDVIEDRPGSPCSKLSYREMEVLALLANGKTIIRIAGELSLSPKTISTYRARLLTKLNLKTTADLIRYSITEIEKNR